jgi:hypothetical protein
MNLMKKTLISFVLLFIIFFAPVSAQVAIGPGVATAVGDAAYNWFGAKAFAGSLESGASGSLGWGGVVRYAGAGAITAGAVVLALDWFYNTLKAQTATSLDEYYSWIDYAAVDIQSLGVVNNASYYMWTAFTRPNNANITVQDTAHKCDADITCIKAWIRELRPQYFNVAPYDRYVWVDGNNNNLSSWRHVQRPSLQNFYSGNYPNGNPHPDAQEGLKRVMQRYARDVLANGGAPGLKYTPVPNVNQFKTQAPFVPYIDTDGDGFSDTDEIGVFPPSDPMDPQSKPETDPNANSDGTCKAGFGRVGGVTACVPVGLVNDPNANSDGTCKTGYGRASPTATCTLATTPDPNANTDSTCKAGFVRTVPGGLCLPEPEKVCTFPAILSADKKSCVEPVPVTSGTGECAKLAGEGFAGFVSNFWGNLQNTFLCVFKPQENIPDKLTARFQTIKTKFPFSVVTALQNKITASGNENPDGLPSALGNIPLDWSGIGGLWSTIKTASGFLIWFSFIWFIVSKITPQAII